MLHYFWGVDFLKFKKGFSYYDVEQFLKEAGAEKVNERALTSFKEELEDEVKSLLNEAEMCATYAGRKSLIKCSDIDLAEKLNVKRTYFVGKRTKHRIKAKPPRIREVA